MAPREGPGAGAILTRQRWWPGWQPWNRRRHDRLLMRMLLLLLLLLLPAAGGLESEPRPCERVDAWGPAEVGGLLGASASSVTAVGLTAADLLVAGRVDAEVLADLGVGSALERRRALDAVA
eukprot:SAG22_NODE_6822_length_807_cov_1.134181_2_plen_121_part_01